MEDKKKEIGKEEKKEEKEIEEKVEEIGKEEKEKARGKKEKKKKPEIIKKDKAVVRGKNLSISTKQSIALCKFIRGKTIEKAVSELEEVTAKKRAIPMKGEYPHRKGRGMERGRYPVKACQIFIELLKSLAANSIVNNMENVYIAIAKADIASRPYKRFGSQRFKRTNVFLEVREIKVKEREEKPREKIKI